MSWEESDLALLPKRIQKQARQQLKPSKGSIIEATKKKRDDPEKRLVQNPTIEYCQLLGVEYVHIPKTKRQNKDGTWRHFTAYEGTIVLLDLILTKNGVRVDLELKAPGRKPTEDQIKAMHHLDGFWTDNPLDAAKVVEYVAGKAPMFSFDSTRKVI